MNNMNKKFVIIIIILLLAITGACSRKPAVETSPSPGQEMGSSSENQAVFDAASGKNFDAVEKAVKANPKLVKETDKTGMTLLHWAAVKGNSAVLEFLLEKGADVSVKDSDGRTPLHCATDREREPVVDENQGAEKEHSNEWKIANALITRGANLKAADGKGCTPLHYAAERGSVDVASLLIGKGAGLEARDKKGLTPLHYASKQVWVAYDPGKERMAPGRQMLELLISKGADVNAADNKGRMPLHLAAGMGLIDVVKVLVEKGAKINARDAKGKTPLHYGNLANLKYRTWDVAEYLKSKGAKE